MRETDSLLMLSPVESIFSIVAAHVRPFRSNRFVRMRVRPAKYAMQPPTPRKTRGRITAAPFAPPHPPPTAPRHAPERNTKPRPANGQPDTSEHDESRHELVAVTEDVGGDRPGWRLANERVHVGAGHQGLAQDIPHQPGH